METLQRRSPGHAHTGCSITPRQREVLTALAEGMTNRQIADRLVISEATVHSHLARLFIVTGINSRTTLAIWAIAAGLVEWPRFEGLLIPDCYPTVKEDSGRA
jgi:DNA-binding NarL/FixJ family response regulator